MKKKKRLQKPISYERLFEIARKLHLEIFKLVNNEQEVYDRLGLTEEENSFLGYTNLNGMISNPENMKLLKELILKNIENEEKR